MAEKEPVVRTRNAACFAGWRRAGFGAVVTVCLAACAGPQTLPPGPGPATPRIEADGRAFIARDGYRLRWSVWSAERPKGVIVALHGMNDYGETFKGAAEFWAAQGFTTYAFDQRGFGRTLGDGIWPGTRALINDVQDSLAAVRARHPGVPLFLAGESMGGAVALAALGDPGTPPVVGAALIAPGLQGWSRLSAVERAALWTIAHVTPAEPLTGRGLGLKPTDNQDRLKQMSADPFVIKRMRADAFYGLVRLMDDAVRTAGSVKTPVLIVFGEKDDIAPIAPARELAQQLGPAARFVSYPNGFHLLLHGDNKARVFQDIRDHFLSSIQP
jgi:acylglycerol lipase